MTKTYRRKWFYHGAIISQRGDAYQAEINFNSKRHRMTLLLLVEAKTYVEQKVTVHGVSNEESRSGASFFRISGAVCRESGVE